MGVDVRKFFICLSCKLKVVDVFEIVIVKCSSCILKIKKSESVFIVTVNIMIKDENGEIMGRFFCFYSVIKILFEEIVKVLGFNIEKNIEKLLGDIMENIFLNIVRLFFKKDKRVIFKRVFFIVFFDNFLIFFSMLNFGVFVIFLNEVFIVL